MARRLKYTLYWVLSVGLLKTTDSAVIQAMIDFDDNSEDLIESLISKVDHIIDPVKDDMRNVSISLALALLKLAPTVSITGNVSDGSGNSMTLTFSFSATTSDSMISHHNHPVVHLHHSIHHHPLDDESGIWRGRGGVFEPIVAVVEPWVLFILEVAAHSILGVIVTQILQATTLLENVPFA